ncbi:hypothetical protein BJ165DRAFT_1502999, partial [Panaeolus papilionaceus]
MWVMSWQHFSSLVCSLVLVFFILLIYSSWTVIPNLFISCPHPLSSPLSILPFFLCLLLLSGNIMG